MRDIRRRTSDAGSAGLECVVGPERGARTGRCNVDVNVELQRRIRRSRLSQTISSCSGDHARDRCQAGVFGAEVAAGQLGGVRQYLPKNGE